MKTGRKFALALTVAALGAGSAGAASVVGGGGNAGGGGEVFNCFEPLPPQSMTGGATSFTIVFAGNVLSEIDTAGTQNDSGLNPFLYLNNQLNNGGTTTVTATLDGNGNTDVTLSGTNAIMYDSSFGGNGDPHVGLASSGSGGTLDLISQTWSNSVNMTSYTLPGGISVSVANGGVPTTDPFAILFAEVTSNGNTVGQWFELPYTSTQPMLTITNYTGSAETLSNVGYYLSPTQIPLDDLNFGLNPPPGSPGSPFIPLPNLDGQTLAGGDGIGGPGGSITSQALPEPSSIISMGTGLLLVVAGYFRRRRIIM